MSNAATNSIHTEPFTQTPNRYLDYIAPKLTGTERDVVEVVIRYTYGYHKPSARIPNRVFMSRTGKSEPTLIKAKKSLIDKGILVVINNGGGSTTEYSIDVYYNKVERSIKARLPQLLPRLHKQIDELRVDDKELNIQDVISDVNMAAPLVVNSQISDVNNIDEPTIASDVSLSEPDLTIESDIEAPTTESDVDMGHPLSPITTNVPQIESSRITTTTSLPTISDAHVPTESIMMDSNALPTTKETLVPSYNDLKSININKKTNIELNSEHNVTTDNKNGGVIQVRCLFSNSFSESITDSDWSYFGYLTSTYGVDTCIDKINYMCEHRRRHPITNPKGFLRRALEYDYTPPAFILAKIKADRAAKLALERSRKESQEWRTMVQQFDYEASMAALNKLMVTLS